MPAATAMTPAPALAPFAVVRQTAEGRAVPAAKRTTAAGRARTFTREEILAKIGEWVALHGEPPSMRDWEPSRARRAGQAWRAERFEGGGWPSARMVVAQFGAFTTAIREAGFEPRRRPSRLKPKLAGREQIVAAIREWVGRYGEPPTLADWDGVRARRLRQEWRIARYRSGDWPSLASVIYHYGSLGAAVKAAGLPKRPHGLPARHAAGYRAQSRRMHVLESAANGDDDLTVAGSLRDVARYRAAGDHEGLHRSLLALAAAALRWADDVAVADVD
jgi:hypothetical protein